MRGGCVLHCGAFSKNIFRECLVFFNARRKYNKNFKEFAIKRKFRVFNGRLKRTKSQRTPELKAVTR